MDDAERENQPQTARRFPAARFVAVFLTLFGTLYALYSYSEWVRDNLIQPWTRAVAAISTPIIRLVYPDVHRVGNAVLGEHFKMEVVDGCNGIEPLLLLLAGIIAFPATLKARAIGLAIGLPLIIVINKIRVVGLYFLGAGLPRWFDASHIFVAQAVVILLTAGFWLWWLGRFAAPALTIRPATPAAPPPGGDNDAG